MKIVAKYKIQSYNVLFECLLVPIVIFRFQMFAGVPISHSRTKTELSQLKSNRRFCKSLPGSQDSRHQRTSSRATVKPGDTENLSDANDFEFLQKCL